MASASARRVFQKSTSLIGRSVSHKSSPCAATAPSCLAGAAPTAPRISLRHRSFFSSRLPVELGCGESLMPLHSVTASALLNSLLSSDVVQWGCLSEGFATPL